MAQYEAWPASGKRATIDVVRNNCDKRIKEEEGVRTKKRVKQVARLANQRHRHGSSLPSHPSMRRANLHNLMLILLFVIVCHVTKTIEQTHTTIVANCSPSHAPDEIILINDKLRISTNEPQVFFNNRRHARSARERRQIGQNVADERDYGKSNELVSQTTSSSVLCNSRCACVQLEFYATDKQQQEQQQQRQATTNEHKQSSIIINSNSTQASDNEHNVVAAVELALIQFSEDYSFSEEDGDATGSAAAAASTTSDDDDDDDSNVGKRRKSAETTTTTATEGSGLQHRTSGKINNSFNRAVERSASGSDGESRKSTEARQSSPSPPQLERNNSQPLADKQHQTHARNVDDQSNSLPAMANNSSLNATQSQQTNKTNSSSSSSSSDNNNIVQHPSHRSALSNDTNLNIKQRANESSSSSSHEGDKQRANNNNNNNNTTQQLEQYGWFGSPSAELQQHERSLLSQQASTSGATKLTSSKATPLSQFAVGKNFYHRHQTHNVLMQANNDDTAPIASKQHHTPDPSIERHLFNVAHGRKLKRFVPLKKLDMSRELMNANVTLVVRLLDQLDTSQIQSLILRNNALKFELLTELYALLAIPMRHHLQHLDLAHNSLTKLGVMFTGYIEHHLAYQLVHNNGSAQHSWPFSVVAKRVNTTTTDSLSINSSSSLQPTHTHGNIHLSNYFKFLPFKLTPNKSIASRSAHYLRHPVLGDGKLYEAVVQFITNNNNKSLLLSPVVNTQQASLLRQSAQIKALDLSYNKLKWLINDQFRVLKHLQTIRLDHNKIRFIHQQAFNGLEMLKFVNLNYNKIQTIYMEQFQTNYNLQALFLRSNYLTYLRAGSLASLMKLKHLDMSKNKFTILSNNAFVGLDSLESLNLSTNQFVHVPATSFHPLIMRLKLLDMSNNQLVRLAPGTFFHFQHLEELYLNQNEQLQTIDRGAFWDLPYLHHLSMRLNPMLGEINSQAFVGVPNLKSIQVDECNLLDERTKQMLENVTLASTRHKLLLSSSSSSSSPVPLQASYLRSEIEHQDGDNKTQQQQQHQTGKPMMLLDDEGTNLQRGAQINFYDQSLASAKLMKYFYSLGLICLAIGALKLLFKYTSQSHYADMRRKRRRVYQTSEIDNSSNSGSSSDRNSNEDDDNEDEEEHETDNRQQADSSLSATSLVESDTQMHTNRTTENNLSIIATNNTNFGRSTPPVESLHESLAFGNESFALQERKSNSQNVIFGSNVSAPMAADDCEQVAISNCLSEGLDVMNDATAAGDVDDCNRQQQSTVETASACNCPDCCQQERQQFVEVDISGPSCVYDNDQMCYTPTTPKEEQQLETYHEYSDNNKICSDANQPQSNERLVMAAAAYDYGHSNCDHFYQSLGPALQLAHMTESLCNQMDYYS